MSTFRMIFLSSLLSGIVAINSSAQTCDCKKEVDFLLQAYLNDYAGMSDFKAAHPDAIIPKKEKDEIGFVAKTRS